jgi:hypothetical protein
MGLPSLLLDARMFESWQNDLQSAGYSVIEERTTKDCSEAKGRVQEQLFTVQLNDEWVHILAFRKVDSEEAGLVAMTHERGSNVDFARRIFAHLSGVTVDRES